MAVRDVTGRWMRHLTLTVKVFVVPAGDRVKTTFAVPAFVANSVVIDVPGASGWLSGGSTCLVPETVTGPDPEACQVSPLSSGICTTIFCPTPAATVAGNDATNSGAAGLVGVGVGVARRVNVGLGVGVGDGLAVALGFLVVVLALGSTSAAVWLVQPVAMPPTSSNDPATQTRRSLRCEAAGFVRMFPSVPHPGARTRHRC